MANRNFASKGFIYSMHTMPVLVDCNFVVDSTNGNGLGIRSLKGPLVSNVFMHTSAPLAGSGNPNPASGVIVLQLSDSYNRYFGGFSGQGSAIGSSGTSITANTAYVITSLGTATAAQWVAAGVPLSIVQSGANGLPNVGTAFIAAASLTIGGGATAAPSAASGSGIDHIEVLGDPNQSIQSTGTGINQIILQCFSGGVLTAPANGSVIQLSTYLSNSSVMVQGE